MIDGDVHDPEHVNHDHVDHDHDHVNHDLEDFDLYRSRLAADTSFALLIHTLESQNVNDISCLDDSMIYKKV